MTWVMAPGATYLKQHTHNPIIAGGYAHAHWIDSEAIEYFFI
jgi:hypothetical protein